MHLERPSRPARILAALLVPAVFLALGIPVLRALSGDDARPDATSTPDVSSPGEAALFDPFVLSRCVSGELEPIASDDGPGGSLELRIRSIAKVVENLRSLRFRGPVEVEILTTGAVAERVRRSFEHDYPRATAERDELVLRALGAAPQRDLRSVVSDALQSQVSGFYAPGSGELVVRRSPGGKLGPVEEITLVHELEHALADRRLGLPDVEGSDPATADRRLAALSLVEGDATLTMTRYAAAALTPGETSEISGDPEVQRAAEEGLDDLSHYVRRGLLFPYTEGLAFVCHLFSEGGWAAVNAAYEDPPDSTAQILFPDRYRSGEKPILPRPMRKPGGGWAHRYRVQLGAADLLWLFEAPGGDGSLALGDPLAAAADWGGGELRMWTRGGRSAVGIALVRREEGDLCGSVADWYSAMRPVGMDEGTRRGEVFARASLGYSAVLWCAGDEVRLGIGPNVMTARALASR